MVQRGSVRRARGYPPDRLRPGRDAGRGTPAKAHHRRRFGLSALHRFRSLPRHRRQRRRDADGGHGAFRRTGGGRRASEPGAGRRRHNDDDPQDPARRPRRHDPDERRSAREEDQLGGVSRFPGRAADAPDRRQGGCLQGSADAGVQDLLRGHRRECEGALCPSGRARFRHGGGRHRHPPDAGRSAAQEGDWQYCRRKPGAGRDHLQQETPSRSIPRSRP